MVAVSDTSVISNLAIIGRLSLLPAQFRLVLVPDAVATELTRIPDADAAQFISQAFSDGWLQRRSIGNPSLAGALSNDLDPGEAEAIALASENAADVVLMDEKEGRAFARSAGFPIRGVLGILLRGKRQGQVSSVRDEINRLRARARFFISPALEAEVLRSVSE